MWRGPLPSVTASMGLPRTEDPIFVQPGASASAGWVGSEDWVSVGSQGAGTVGSDEHAASGRKKRMNKGGRIGIPRAGGSEMSSDRRGSAGPDFARLHWPGTLGLGIYTGIG